jgi:hypothetical protein
MAASLMRIALLLVLTGCAGAPPQAVANQQTTHGARAPERVIRWFGVALDGIKVNNPEVRLRVGHDPALGDRNVLFVDYPKPSEDPAGRDVWFETELKDWSKGRALSVLMKPDHPLKVSVSFSDRNHVAYTFWVDLTSGWNDVRVAFDEIRPNPYSQPPDAKPGSPLDVSEVNAIGFAPQDEVAGSLALTHFVLSD